MIPYCEVGGTYCAVAGRLREVLSLSPYAGWSAA
jgi:hypothetical protein